MQAFPRVVVALAVTTLVVAPGSSQDKPAAKKDLPLEPARTLEFTTDEGSWLSLDVSPDGKTVKGAPARPGVARPVAPTTAR